MPSDINHKIDKLVREIPKLIENFSYRKGPDLYFYKKTIGLRRSKQLATLLNGSDESDHYIELIYATLVAWDMNSRGAKMKYFDEFKSAILTNSERLIQLQNYKIDRIPTGIFGEVKTRCGLVYDDMHLMLSGGRLVSNSKTMHFLLPDLVMPMDRQNTLNYFFGNTSEPPNNSHFLKILGFSHEIAQRIDLNHLIDDNWNLSVPKVIDNAIISNESPKYTKQSARASA